METPPSAPPLSSATLGMINVLSCMRFATAASFYFAPQSTSALIGFPFTSDMAFLLRTNGAKDGLFGALLYTARERR